MTVNLDADELARLDSIAARSGVVASTPKGFDSAADNLNAARKAVLSAAARTFLTGAVPIPDAVAAAQWAVLDDAGREAVRLSLLRESGRAQRERVADAYDAMKAAEREAKARRAAEVRARKAAAVAERRAAKAAEKILDRMGRRAETMARHDAPTGPQNPIWALLGSDAGNHSREG